MSITNDYYQALFAEHIRDAFKDKGNRKNMHVLIWGIRLVVKKKYKKAIRIFDYLERKCSTNDDFCVVHTFKSSCLQELGYNELAIEGYKKVLHYDSNRPQVLSNLGLLYKDLGEYDNAIKYYTRSIGLDSSNPYPINNIAHLYYCMGEFENAKKYALTALKIKGNLYAASNCACLSSYALGDDKEGDKYYKISLLNGADRDALNNAVETAKALYDLDEIDCD